MGSTDIHVSAVVMHDRAGRVLHVRKRGTHMLMLPGGKPESGETPAETALREFTEELGASLDANKLTSLGIFRAPAANEPGQEVVAHVFEHPPLELCHAESLKAHGEIAEVVWVDPSEHRPDVAPLNTLQVFPALAARSS